MAVMPALVAGIHVLTAPVAKKTWMAGPSPAMTEEGARVAPGPRICAAARPGHGNRVDASGGNTMAVMPALVAGIHVLTAPVAKKTWLPGQGRP